MSPDEREVVVRGVHSQIDQLKDLLQQRWKYLHTPLGWRSVVGGSEQAGALKERGDHNWPAKAGLL